VVGGEPVVQELQELAELHGVVQAEVHRRCPAAWQMAMVTSSRLRWSRPGMASRRLTGVTGGEAGGDPDDAPLPATGGQAGAVEGSDDCVPSQSIHAVAPQAPLLTLVKA
jgi:hypothetical protein